MKALPDRSALLGLCPEELRFARYVDHILIFLAALLPLAPSILQGASSGHDYPYHIAWVREFAAQIESGGA